MDKLRKEYDAQIKRYLDGNKISKLMILVGLVFMGIGLMNRNSTGKMILFFALTIGACVIGVQVGQRRKAGLSAYVGQTVTRKVMEEYYQVDDFIMHGETPLDEIRMTEFFWNYNRIIGSRVIRGKSEGTSFQCSNVTLDETTGTANKNTRVFCGQYIFADLKEPAPCTIRILDMENPVKKLVQGCRPMKLSSIQEFDDLFEVSAVDPAAAKTFLTEERRKDLVKLKQLIREKGGEEKGQLNLMYKGNKLYAALGTGVFLFHRQTELRDVEEIIEYNSLDAQFVQNALRHLR